jgi:hypothetical protein
MVTDFIIPRRRLIARNVSDEPTGLAEALSMHGGQTNYFRC